MKKLEKKYSFTEAEKKWQEYWQEAGIFKFNWNDTKRENIYSIDTPPPHVSGALHMGHIFGYTQMDVTARFWRMFGKNVFYPFGFDDNGLPSERYVEKKLGIKSKSMNRQEFVKICDKEIRDAELYMKSNAIQANYSFDFDEEYRTISPTARKVSQMSFLDLYNKGILERQEEPVIWDVVDQTALAQTEAEDKEVESQMNYIIFTIKNNKSDAKINNIQENSTIFLNTLNIKNFAKNYINDIIIPYCKSRLISVTTDYTTALNYGIKNVITFDNSTKKIVLTKGYQGTNNQTTNYDYEEVFIPIEDLFYCKENLTKIINFFENKTADFCSVDFDLKNNRFNQLNYNNIIIMTTRPELLGACVAIFVHPNNKEQYEGKSAVTPFGVEVPILFDESIEMQKGTGVMMCCTFGDNADVEKYKKYKLPLKMIINEKGCLYFDNVPEIAEKYKTRLDGLFTTKAKEEILNILQEEGKIVKPAEKITHTVKIGERSKSPLEIMVKKQWNIRVLDIKDELHKKASEVKWHPAWMEGRIHSWIDGLNWNWCISRQRFFGVPVPCWYSKRAAEEGKVILPTVEQLPIDPTVDLPKGYTADEVFGETDVFDTWMTSSVSPQLSTQGFREDYCCDKNRFKTLDIPFDLRPQGHDIIRTWAFCTLVKSYYHEDTIPWKNIFVNGFALASDGTKMSKSAGNGVDPIKSMKEFGTDAVRYWASNGAAGVDTNYSVDVIKNGQKLITKLFNSAKFAEMNFENIIGSISTAKEDIKNGLICETIDKWLISRIKTVIEKSTKSFENYEYSKALEAVENFFWSDFCDNYLEIVKVRCYGANGLKYQNIELSKEEKEKIDKAQQSAIRTIYYVFNAVLKLFAPFTPAICDEIYSCLYEEEFNQTKSISSRSTWAKVENFVENKEIEEIGKVVLDIITDVRKYKSEKNISIKEILPNITIYCNNAENLVSLSEDLKNVCNITDIKFISDKNFRVVF